MTLAVGGRNLRRSLRGLALVGVALSLACGGDDNGTNTGGGGNEQPAIAVALSPTSLDVTAGSNATATLTVTRSGGFAGAVSVSASGVPSGVTIAPITIAAGQTSGTLTVAAADNATVGAATVTVTASSTGVTSKTASLSLNVKAAPQQGGFTVAVMPSDTVSVQAGDSATATIMLTRTGGFTGAVGLSVTGAPTGLTVRLDSTSISGAQTTLHVVTTSALAAGSYPLTVHATATGLTEQTATAVVKVTAPAQAGSFTLAASPASVSVQAGANATSTVTITRGGGFTGAVALTATSAPAGITATFNPASATGDQSTVTLAAPSGQAAGTYVVTIHGNASGLAEQTATVNVQVTAPSTGGGNVSFAFCGETPIWAAVQDGTGAWTQAPISNGAISFDLNSGKGGVAYVTGNAATGYQLTVLYATAQELGAPGQAGACQNATSTTGKTVNGSIVGMGPTNGAAVALGNASGTATAFLFGQTTFTLTNVPDGSVDLGAALTGISGTSLVVDKLFLQRGLNPADGSTLQPIDFGGSDAFDPVTKQLTVANLGTDQAGLTVSFHTAGGIMIPYSVGATSSTGNTFSFPAVPSDKLISGDFHTVQVLATPGENATSGRMAGISFHDPADQTVTLGPSLSAATASVLGTSPNALIGISYGAQSEYNTLWSAVFSQGTNAASRAVTVTMTAGYAAGAGTIELDVPDLSGAAGWNSDWGLKQGAATAWTLTAFGWTGGNGSFGPFGEGVTFKEAYQTGTITP